MSLVRHYYVIFTSLLHIITFIITSLLRHYYVIGMPLLCVITNPCHYYVLLQFLHYYVIITSLLHIITNPLLPVITSLLRHYYVIITSLSHSLHIITKALLPVITSLLRHYYVVITSLLHMAKCVIMSPLLSIITWCISIIMSLLGIITIITYYYVFETEQLADASDFCVYSVTVCHRLQIF